MKKLPVVLLGMSLCFGALAPAAAAAAAEKAPNVRPWLLGVANVPPGWSASTDNLAGSAQAECFAIGAQLEAQHPGSSAAVSFATSAANAMGEVIYSWPTPADAHHAWEVVTGRLDRCHRFSAKSSGSRVDCSAQALKLSRYGEGSAGYALTLKAGGTTDAADYLVALKGRGVVAVYYADQSFFLSGEFQTDVLPLFQQAVAKMAG